MYIGEKEKIRLMEDLKFSLVQTWEQIPVKNKSTNFLVASKK